MDYEELIEASMDEPLIYYKKVYQGSEHKMDYEYFIEYMWPHIKAGKYVDD